MVGATPKSGWQRPVKALQLWMMLGFLIQLACAQTENVGKEVMKEKKKEPEMDNTNLYHQSLACTTHVVYVPQRMNQHQDCYQLWRSTYSVIQ